MNISELPRYKIRDDLPEHKQIVAFIIDGVITNDLDEIRDALNRGKHVKLISKLMAYLMFKCDLGDHWKKIADSPPILGIEEDGELCLVKGGHFPNVDCIIEGLV
jgi:hypothetical protein